MNSHGILTGGEPGTSPRVRLPWRGGGEKGKRGGRGTGNGQGLGWRENKAGHTKASSGCEPNGRSYVSLLLAPAGLSGRLLLLRSSGG